MISRADKIAKKIFLFGSFITSSNPKDIDILFLYEIEELNDYKLAVEFRNQISLLLKNKFNIDVDVILLTCNEEKEMKFVERENAKLFWSV